MTSQAASEVIARLGTRKAMQDPTFFVGRKQKLLELEPCLRGNAAWLSGVRRIGKSSLARQLMARGSKHGTRSVWVGMGDVTGLDFFEQMLTRTLSEAGVVRTETPRSDFEALAYSAREDSPVLIVYDEFDRIAANLQTDEQAFLRRLTDHCEHFGYLFITRTEPGVLVEQVPDEMSRLLGVCTLVRMGGLERGDVPELMTRVAKALDCPEASECAESIWSLVGGHSIAVMALATAVAVQLTYNGWHSGLFGEVQDLRKREVLDMLGSLWRDLAPAIREALLEGDPTSLSDGVRGMLRSDGYHARADGLIRPAWLLEVGKALGIAPPSVGFDQQPMSHVERFHDLIFSVNAILRRGGYPRGFELSPEVLQHYWLTRIDTNKGNLIESVNHLSKVIYEGARKKVGKNGKCRLPAPLVSKLTRHRGFLHLVALRNFYDHDPEWDKDGERLNQNFLNEGDVYLCHCGVRHPTEPSHWLHIRTGLLQDLIGMLEELEAEARSLPSMSGNS